MTIQCEKESITGRDSDGLTNSSEERDIVVCCVSVCKCVCVSLCVCKRVGESGREYGDGCANV